MKRQAYYDQNACGQKITEVTESSPDLGGVPGNRFPAGEMWPWPRFLWSTLQLSSDTDDQAAYC